MDEWFNRFASLRRLPEDAIRDLHDVGFAAVPGPVPADRMAPLVEAYDAVMAKACVEAAASDSKDEVSIGLTTNRVHNLVNRSREFDEIYLCEPVLEACCRVIGQPFKLSAMLARTVRAGSPAQVLHADFKRDSDGSPMVGFILMIDEFRSDNGATRFVPGSHTRHESPDDVMDDTTADCHGQVVACGPAGSMIIYNGSVWHGHTANESAQPRRSIQGAFIRRSEQGWHQRSRMRDETLRRIGDLAQYLLALS